MVGLNLALASFNSYLYALSVGIFFVLKITSRNIPELQDNYTMQTNNDNGKCIYGIEKFEGNFDKEELGVTIIPNKSINEITNIEALGLYVFLLARPHGWKLNVNHLKDHFKLGRDKVRKNLNWLLNNKYISCTVSREKGRFSKPHYRVHLHSHNLPTPVINTEFSPETEIQAPVNPSTVDQYAYKTKNIENKESNNTPIIPKGMECAFAIFWSLYPIKKARKQCERKWKRFKLDEKADEILLALKNQLANDDEWKRGFIPHPLTYINGELWTDEIAKPKNTGNNGSSEASKPTCTNGVGSAYDVSHWS